VDRNAPEKRKPSIRQVIGEVDFAHMVDLYLATGPAKEDREHIEDMIVSFLDVSINDFLDRLLMEPEQSNRRALLSLASRFGGEAFPAIRERLGDPRWFFLRNLCLILGKIGPPESIPELIRLLDHDDSRVRREAIQALGKMQAQESIPFLGKILLRESLLPSAREDSLRIDAANALFRCGGTKSIDFLRRGAECRRKTVREHCAALLGTLEAR
jgi:HEAT repeat protein